jgi:N-acetylglutamate synthase-like GNAT family acetyltransferase
VLTSIIWHRPLHLPEFGTALALRLDGKEFSKKGLANFASYCGVFAAKMSQHTPHPKPVRLRHEWRSSDAALVVDLHRLGYAAHGSRFGQDFLDHVRETIDEASLEKRDHRSRVWFAERNEKTLGVAAMIDRGDEGQLRWFVALPDARGLGVGRTLFTAAMDHARAQGWPSVYLHTTDGLDASMRLYLRNGFELVSDEEDDLWHGRGRLIVMRRQL